MPEDAGARRELVELGLVERVDDGRLRVLDPALLTAGLQVWRWACRPAALVAAQMRVIEHVREIADLRVDVPRDPLAGLLVDAGAPPEQMERVRETVARLQPAAAQALLAASAPRWPAPCEDAVEAALSRLGES